MGLMSIDELVHEERVHGSIYTDPMIFDLEMKRIFETTWVYVGHESEIQNPGDYKTTFIGTNPVIVSRGADDGRIHVMFNRCRHRSASVCQLEQGNANFFRCAYHGWTYQNTGDLIGVPLQDGYQQLNKAEMGLTHVARVDSYQGFIFASMSPLVSSLHDFLGFGRTILDQIASSGPHGIELSAGAQKLTYRGNWKLQVENTIDPYHLGFVHKSFYDMFEKRVGTKISFSQIHKKERISALGNGHSLYELAGDLGLGSLPFNLIVFPTLGFVGSHVRVTRPISVDRTEVRLYPILLKEVSREQNAARLRAHEGFYGPASFGTPDDIEVAFDRVQEGLRAKGVEWLEISRGMHHETLHEELGVPSSDSSDEVATREFYRAWKQLMLH